MLRRYLSPRLFEEVAGDLQERWTADRSISRRRAWHNLLRLTASILWHTTTESRRTASPRPAGVSMFTGIGRDLRFAWRLAVRQPWLVAVWETVPSASIFENTPAPRR